MSRFFIGDAFNFSSKMTILLATDILKDMFWVTLKILMAPLLISLAIGVVVALLQALTHIQEMTLTFIPKMIGLFITLSLTFPYMTSSLMTFSERLYGKIVVINEFSEEGQ